MQAYVKKPVIVHAFKYDGKISTLLKNLNAADMAFYFEVQYPGKEQGKDPDIHGKATKLILHKDSGDYTVPVGSTVYRTKDYEWHIKK